MTYNQFTRMWWLVGKHAAVDLHAQHTTQCTQCDQVYDAWSPADKQGHDTCAWSLYKDGRWFIHCGYGSEFDLSEFAYIDQYPTAPQDPICDWCIRRMLRDGVIVYTGRELPIGGV